MSVIIVHPEKQLASAVTHTHTQACSLFYNILSDNIPIILNTIDFLHLVLHFMILKYSHIATSVKIPNQN